MDIHFLFGRMLISKMPEYTSYLAGVYLAEAVPLVVIGKTLKDSEDKKKNSSSWFCVVTEHRQYTNNTPMCICSRQ